MNRSVSFNEADLTLGIVARWKISRLAPSGIILRSLGVLM
jgi:hypothetical protein